MSTEPPGAATPMRSIAGAAQETAKRGRPARQGASALLARRDRGRGFYSRAATLAIFVLVACRADPAPKSEFPPAGRDVAPIVGDSFSTEDARDRLGEAEAVIAFAGVARGMSVADIGAGEGYYTVRLSGVVGPRGRVLAEDIVPQTRDRLALRVNRENLDNVAVRLGQPQNPKLPPASFDRIFLVHVYHEVDRPYEFLWHLRQGLKPGGMIVVVDADRPVKRHGTPPALLDCEFGSVGLARTKEAPLEASDSYMALFGIAGPLPEPGAIKPCAVKG